MEANSGRNVAQAILTMIVIATKKIVSTKFRFHKEPMIAKVNTQIGAAQTDQNNRLAVDLPSCIASRGNGESEYANMKATMTKASN